MRVMILGTLAGEMASAAQIALGQGAKIVYAATCEEAFNNLRQTASYDLILMDIHLDIPTFVEALQQERIHASVVACGINVTPALAQKAIEGGAMEYLPLPPEADLIAAIFTSLTQPPSSLIFKDPAMDKWIRLADKIAPSQASVFITGESGTGKEVMAQYIWRQSKRSQKPFVSLNCAAIPENLLESELFGHEKGAFTGAIARRIGKFEEADGGTILLDEITEMHPRLQAKLLRAIQEKLIDRVGGTQPVKVDIRIIATSNRNMMEAIKQGEFREDLYYRLNVVNIHIPPLRERPGDILPLASFFAKKYADLNSMSVKPFSENCRNVLCGYDWPGNVRQLENYLHRALLLSQGKEIEAEDIFDDRPSTSTPIGDNDSLAPFVGRTVAAMERDLILGTLDHCDGNRTHAANILGISIRTLRNKLRDYAQGALPNNESVGVFLKAM